MRKNEDIIKRLNKQKPLIKSKDLQPLSPRDFNPKKNTLIIPVEKKADKRGNKRPQIEVFPGVSLDARKTAYKRPEELHETKLKAKSGRDRQDAEESLSKREPEIFTQDSRHVKIPSAPSRLDVFAENVKHDRPAGGFRTIRVDKKAEEIDIDKQSAVSGQGLQFRHEFKYYINYRDYILLRSALKALMRFDQHAGDDGTYFVRSLYFDDIYESSLMEKIAGNDYRSKYRIRIYNLKDDHIRFEKKSKVGQYITKTSISLSHNEYDSIISGDYSFLLDRNEDLASEIYLEMKNNLLRPRVIVDYTREAYVSQFENCRITFDKDLRAGHMNKDIFDPAAPVMPMYDSGIMVFEVKFGRFLPEHIKRILNNVNAADRCAISKYVICRKYE